MLTMLAHVLVLVLVGRVGVQDEGTRKPEMKLDEAPAGAAPHDMFKSEITLLVDALVGKEMLEGMGLLGIFVQAIQVEPKPEKKKKGKAEGLPTEFWYVQHLYHVATSSSWYTIM